jgi:hypothetical protein
LSCETRNIYFSERKHVIADIFQIFRNNCSFMVNITFHNTLTRKIVFLPMKKRRTNLYIPVIKIKGTHFFFAFILNTGEVDFPYPQNGNFSRNFPYYSKSATCLFLFSVIATEDFIVIITVSTADSIISFFLYSINNIEFSLYINIITIMLHFILL